MRKGFLVVALLLCGCSMSKEARMGAIGDTLARAVAERDEAKQLLGEQRLLNSLYIDGWQAERDARLETATQLDAARGQVRELTLENASLRDSVRRQSQRLRCVELSYEEAKRELQVLHSRLNGSCFTPIIMPSPADLGIEQSALPSIQEKVEPLVDEPPF